MELGMVSGVNAEMIARFQEMKLNSWIKRERDFFSMG